MDEEKKGTIELISEISDLNDMHEYMNDEQLDRALELLIKLLANPQPHNHNLPRLIVELQALSTKFAVSAALYKTWHRDKAGTPNNYKKDNYYSLVEALNKLVDALKISLRYGVDR